MTIQSAHLASGYKCISGSKLSDMEMHAANRQSIRRVTGTSVAILIFSPRRTMQGLFPVCYYSTGSERSAKLHSKAAILNEEAL